jgi:type I restriction enzyme M protein
MRRENDFCRLDDLKNEADVEQSFMRRLLESLGYGDNAIRPKDSLTTLTVGGMRGQSANYRPDFAIKAGLQVRWIVEAKAPGENLDKHIWQPRGYCTLLNGEYRDDNPVKYFILSNGAKTRLYQWDVNEPLLELSFAEFVDGNVSFAKLKKFLSPVAFKARQPPPPQPLQPIDSKRDLWKKSMRRSHGVISTFTRKITSAKQRASLSL